MWIAAPAIIVFVCTAHYKWPRGRPTGGETARMGEGRRGTVHPLAAIREDVTMDWPKTLVLAVSILALAGVVVLQTSGIHSRIESFVTEAGNDRRAVQQAMDAFRAEVLADRAAYQAEMQRLAERQSHVEGRLATHRPDTAEPFRPAG